MAMDEENRIIHTWSPQMNEMADNVWKLMKGDDRFRRLCKRGNEFNHVSVHAYRKGQQIGNHADRRRHSRRAEQRTRHDHCENSMKEGTAVAVLTVGSPRILSFRRKYGRGNSITIEQDACYEFLQDHGTLFILNPRDEVPKCRRNSDGRRCDDALFVHKVNTVDKDDYFSVAFVFRCLDQTAIVNTATDRVVMSAPQTLKEQSRRKTRAQIRDNDSKPESSFQKQVTEIQSEWIRLMMKRGWMK